jgi:two-component sensor histidine kinase/CheY-like chemotaxis protein
VEREHYRILLIDDNRDDYLVTKRLLSMASRAELELEWIPQPELGLKAMCENQFDAFLLDYHLGRVDGLELLQRAVSGGCTGPIIMFTGLDSPEVDNAAIRYGAADYLDKNGLSAQILERSIRYAIERRKAEEKIKNTLEEKQILLREIHHRVKNNMQIISSLLNLQADKVKNEPTYIAFKESINRVRSIALVHENLYKSKSFVRIDLKDYVNNLISDLYKSFGVDSQRVKMRIDTEDATVSMDLGIPLGLIINELVSNSLRHAFPDDRSGHIDFVYRLVNKRHRLLVRDDGVGLPNNFSVKETDTLGFVLIKSLVEQLRGSMTIDRKNGLTVVIGFDDPG